MSVHLQRSHDGREFRRDKQIQDIFYSPAPTEQVERHRFPFFTLLASDRALHDQPGVIEMRAYVIQHRVSVRSVYPRLEDGRQLPVMTRVADVKTTHIRLSIGSNLA